MVIKTRNMAAKPTMYRVRRPMRIMTAQMNAGESTTCNWRVGRNWGDLRNQLMMQPIEIIDVVIMFKLKDAV